MRFLFLLLLAYLAYRYFMGSRAPELPKKKEATDTHRDPVCGTYVPEDDAVVGNMEGKRIYFCSMKCLEQFQKEQQNR